MTARELVVVTGKGGVGKTTLSAALGHLLAARGKRVLVLEIDPRENLHRLFDTEPSGGDIVSAGERLWYQNLDPRTEIDSLVHARLPLGIIARAVTESPIYHHFVEGAPGLKALAVLGHALRAARGDMDPEVDVVVLDAPATGHGLSMLAAPLLVADVVRGGPVADLAQEIADFTLDPVKSAVVVATLAEEMPVQEALELIDLLEQRLERKPDLVAVNGVYPPFPAAAGDAEALSLWRQRRAVNEQEVKRLAKRWKGPRIELPLIPRTAGPELVTQLAGHLEPALATVEVHA